MGLNTIEVSLVPLTQPFAVPILCLAMLPGKLHA